MLSVIVPFISFFISSTIVSGLTLWSPKFKPKTSLEEFYKAGGIILVDRYTTSNMIHQAGKIQDKEAEELSRLIDDLGAEIDKIVLEGNKELIIVPIVALVTIVTIFTIVNIK